MTMTDFVSSWTYPELVKQRKAGPLALMLTLSGNNGYELWLVDSDRFHEHRWSVEAAREARADGRLDAFLQHQRSRVATPVPAAGEPSPFMLRLIAADFAKSLLESIPRKHPGEFLFLERAGPLSVALVELPNSTEYELWFVDADRWSDHSWTVSEAWRRLGDEDPVAVVKAMLVHQKEAVGWCKGLPDGPPSGSIPPILLRVPHAAELARDIVAKMQEDAPDNQAV